ncbi:MAG: hypothetical protein HY037_02990, partial [Nitrospirae bacterium]|nr:hypothetical protein [Candidatus Troglogloeales bacterium]
MDNSGNAYVTGYTSSTDGTFPVTAGPDITHNGNSDAFVAKISNAAPLPPPAANTPPSTPALFFPADGQTGLGTTIIFRWSQATDPDGDRITYDRCLRAGNTNFTTTDCVPVGDSTALINRAFLYAGFGLIGIVLSGWGAIVRRRKIVVVIALLMITGMALVFCSGRSRRGGPTVSNEVRSTVSGLRSG